MRVLLTIAIALFLLAVLLIALSAKGQPKTYADVAHAAEQKCMERQSSADLAANAGLTQAVYCERYGIKKALQIYGEDHADFR